MTVDLDMLTNWAYEMKRSAEAVLLIGRTDPYMREVADGSRKVSEAIIDATAEIEALRARVEVLERVREAAEWLRNRKEPYRNWPTAIVDGLSLDAALEAAKETP